MQTIQVMHTDWQHNKQYIYTTTLTLLYVLIPQIAIMYRRIKSPILHVTM